MAKLAVAVGEEDHVQGAANAPVTLVEYGDYQCPSCGDAAVAVKKVQKHFGKKLRFVFRNFPLEQHEFALPAAEAAEYAATEGKFWEMHDALFEDQDDLSPAALVRIARELGLEAKSLKSAVEEEAFAAQVQKDLESGEASGVQGTPTFYINGKQHKGSYEYANLVEAIDAVLA